MTETMLPMIIDVFIIVLLGGTIFYAARLSYQLKAFRSNKSELEQLVRVLSANVDKAEQAIEGLRENARSSGRDLQQVINDAQALSEELQYISTSGDRLAERLEKLSRGAPPPSVPAYDLQDNLEEPEIRKPAPKKADALSGFAIRDTDFDQFAHDEMDAHGLMAGDYEDDQQVETRAEKELYEALMGKGIKTGAGGVS